MPIFNKNQFFKLKNDLSSLGNLKIGKLP